MTNSTAAASTPKKLKGPIRTEALVPSLVLIALVYGYFYFFFDKHFKSLLEYGATQGYGAEVNIEAIRTSFLHATFEMTGLEATDASMPARNLFSIGTIRLSLLPDALLRAKGVVEDASILDVQAYSPRKSPGKVLPPPPPGSSILGKAEAQVKDQIRQKLNNNFLGDITEILGGLDPKQKLDAIKGDLKAVAKADALQKELQAKKLEWDKRIKELPRPADVKALEAQVKALNFKGNPIEIAQNVKKARDIIGQAQAKVKQIDEGQKALGTDINTYAAAAESLKSLADQDVQDLQKRFKLPSLDPKEFSTQLFLSQVEGKLVSVRKYAEIARKYMPPKKTKEQIAAERSEALVPRKRGQGRTYTFPITAGYPLFWLKHASLSSEITQSAWAGKVQGTLEDFSTDPVQIQRPFRATLNGDFPKQEIMGFVAKAVMDHTTDTPKETAMIQVASFPVVDMMLSNSDKIKFGLRKATGNSKLDASLEGGAVKVSLDAAFNKADFLLETQSKPVQEILGAVLKGIPTVTLAATVGGPWDNFKFNVDSNLGSALSNGFKKQLDAKLGDAKAQLKAQVEAKLAGPRKQVQDALSALTNGPAKLLGQNKDEMNQSIKSAESSAQPSGGGAKNLLKGFGF